MLKKIIPPTTKRVQSSTNPSVNAQIKNRTVSDLNTYISSSPEILSQRIDALNHEWDVERVVQANAAAVTLVCSLFGMRKSKCFLLTGIVGCFLLQHALQGFCPPLPFIRRLGVRTAEEICNEKTVLKMARGDFSVNTGSATEMLDAVEKQ